MTLVGRAAAGAGLLLSLSACPDTDLPGADLSGTSACSSADLAAFRDASSATSRDDLWVAFVDVGQGDAIWIRTPGDREASAREILVDAGDNGTFSRSNGGEALVQFMTENEFPPGSSIDFLVVTNTDQDHYGGAATLLGSRRGYDVRAYSDPGNASESEGYNNFLAGLSNVPELKILRPARTTLPERFGNFSDGSVELTLLSANEAASSENGASLVIRLDFAGVRLLLTGDVEGDTLEALAAARPADLRAHVLKVAHHGSKNNTSEAILNAVFPRGTGSPDRYAIFTVGPGNSYGHPVPAIVDLVASYVGLRGVYRTDRGDEGKSLVSGPGDDHVLMHVTPDGRLTVCYAYPDTLPPASPP